MTSPRLRHARPARRPRSPRRRLSVRRRATRPRRHSNRDRQLARPGRLARRRPSRRRRRNQRPPPRSFRRFPQRCRTRTHRPSQHLSLPPPSRLRRTRRTCHRRTPHRRRRRVPRRRCRRRDGSSHRAVKNRRGRFCRRPGGRRNVPPKRPRHRGRPWTTRPGLRCRRLVCPCRRNLPTVGRSRPRRRHLVPDLASRFRRRQVLPAHLPAAARRIAQVPLAASDAPQAAAIVRTAVLPVAGAPTPGLRRPPEAAPADPLAVLVREGRGAHHGVVREADRVGVGAVSAKNSSPSSSPPTRRSMHRYLRARSSSSVDRRPKMSPRG